MPSPTASPVLSAAWRSICAPRFSSGSLRSNSLAMVTPSLQTIGAPQLFWISTDFDFGPNVTRTASHSSGGAAQDLLAGSRAEQNLLVSH